MQIKNRYAGDVIFENDAETMALTVKAALEASASLSDADLSGANLRDASLRGADLRGADLSGASLSDASLRGANLRDASLSDASLRGANLRDANLRGAGLRDADLRDASLRDASLRGADLRDADLSGADLRDADLSGADLRGASLSVLFTDIWTAYIQPDYIRIGCQYHAAGDWLSFSDERIKSMEDRAFHWWQQWKPAIQAIHAALLQNKTDAEPATTETEK